MIYYFTGTGNAKYIAEIIRKRTGDSISNINLFTRDKEELVIKEDERVIIVSPVYFWGVPTSVLEFAKLLNEKKRGYTALVLECGGSTGDAQKCFTKYCAVDAVFGVVAVDNYCPLYPVSDGLDQKVSYKLDKLERRVSLLLEDILLEKKGDFNKAKGEFPWFLTPVMYPIYLKHARKTKFKVSDKCIGCGLCESCCNTKAIEIKDGKPVWVKPNCDMCLMCLARCPENAISIGKSFKNGRYLNPRIKYKD